MLIKKLPLFFFCVIFQLYAKGQCSLNLPDTVCPLQNFLVGAPGLSNIKVNTCTAIPTNTVNIIPGVAVNTYQYKIIKEQNRYFAFGQGIGVGFISRYEFNSDFTTLINSSVIIPSPTPSLNTGIGCDMIKNDSGKWVAMMPASDAGKLLIYEFDSIEDSNPEVTDIPIVELNQARQCKIIGHYLFVINNNAPYVTRIEFDNYFNNVISVVNIPGPFSFGWGIDIEYDCESGNYYGFIADDASKIIRMDFGPSLANDTPVCTVLTSAYSETIGIDVAKIKDTWYIFTNNFGIIHRYLQFKLDSITAAPTLMVDVFDNNLNPYSCSVFTDSSVTRVFASSNFAHINFADSTCITNQGTWFEDSSAVNFSFQSTTTGWQYISVTGVDNNNIQQVYFDSVYINIPPPVALFNTNGTCEGQPVIFNDLSSICYGSITGWHWDFGDGNTSSQQSPSHIYASGGNYNVTLTVYAANGDSSIYSMYISVVPVPVADFTPSSFSTCSTYPVIFNDNSTATNDSIVSWHWNFGNQDTSVVQNPVYTYLTGGNFNVSLTVINSNGCMDSVFKTILIMPSPLANFTLTGTCAGGTVFFTNLTDSATNTIVDYNWYFGNLDSSQNADPVFSFPAIDSAYQVQLIATAANGCSTTYTDSVIISHPALISFTQNADTVCKNVPIVYINTSSTQNNDSIVLKRWTFSDGTVIDNADTVTHSFSQSGFQFASLTIVTATYCDSTYANSVYVLDNPTADFVYTNVCLGDSNLFVSNSIPAVGDNLVSYLWNFGDGVSTVISASVFHVYNDTGTYSTSLTILSSKGCSDSITKNVNVYALPVANFITPAVLCNDSLAVFTDYTYLNSDDTLILWNWNFGNSISSTLQNPTNTYSQTGIYNVQLIVETQKGCRDTITKQINVKLSPSPSFTFDSTCHGDFTLFNFIDLSPSTGLINSWNWNFGEIGSGNSTLQHPSHQYQFPGTYTVTVTATDTNQCFKSFNQPVLIHSNPVIGFTTTNPCEMSLAIFNDTSKVIGDTIVQWSWITDNITFSNTSVASYTFNTPGSYLVQLTSTSNAGCSATLIKPVNIYANPVASFAASPAYAVPNQLVSFNNTSSNAVSSSWDFGDGFNSTLTSPTHAFNDTNIFQVTLTVINDKGCADTVYSSYNVLIPDLEIAVAEVNYQVQNKLLALTAKLINLGNISIENYYITSNVEGLPSLVEFSMQPITVASPTVIYTMKSKIEIDNDFDPSYFCIEVEKPNGTDDHNLANNRLCKSIGSSFELLNLVPNPTSDNIQMYLNSPFDQEVLIEIYDDISQLAFRQERVLKKGFSNIFIETNQFRNGIYYLRLTNGSLQLKASFVKI